MNHPINQDAVTEQPEPIYDDLPAEVVEAAMGLQLRQHDGIAQLFYDHSTVVWGTGYRPLLLGGIHHAVWPHLDGQSSVSELTEDVLEVTGADREATRQLMTRFCLDSITHNLVTGGEALDEEWRRWLPPTSSPVGTFETGDSGELRLVHEFDVSPAEVRRLTGGVASVAELMPADSCAGKRIQLNRDATVVSVGVPGSNVAIRCGDEDFISWAGSLPAGGTGEQRGPIVAFVCHDDTGRRRRFSVYDREAVPLVANVSRADAQQAVLGCLAAEASTDLGPDVAELRCHVLRGTSGQVVLAPHASLARPRGMERSLRRRGVIIEPVLRVFLAPDGRTATVVMLPWPESVGIELEEVELAGFWARGNRPGVVEAPHLVTLMVRDSTASSREARERLLQTARQVVEHLPTVVSFSDQRSPDELADPLAELVNGGASGHRR